MTPHETADNPVPGCNLVRFPGQNSAGPKAQRPKLARIWGTRNGGPAGMPSELSNRITQLLHNRHEQVGPVRAEIDRWRDIDSELTGLAKALDQLSRHPSVSPEDAPGLTIPYLEGIHSGIAETIDAYSAVEARFSRETVNIGVSGSARVGKSTLLQS